MRELAPQLFDLLTRAQLLGHVAQHSLERHHSAGRFDFGAAAGGNPVRGAARRHDAELNLHFVAAGRAFAPYRFDALDVVGMYARAHVLDFDPAIGLESKHPQRWTGHPEAPAARVPSPQPKTRRRGSHVQSGLAVPELARQPRGPQRVATQLEGHGAQHDEIG